VQGGWRVEGGWGWRTIHFYCIVTAQYCIKNILGKSPEFNVSGGGR
jgi:hypothetical protein